MTERLFHLKKSLFGGLEEFDSSVEESFSLKPNAKRLIIKPKVTPTASTHQSPAHFVSSNSSTNIPAVASEDSRRPSSATAPSRSETPTSRGESYRNQIPTTAPQPATDDNARRVSWLHSNALEKVTKQNRMSDLPMDNTIKELVTATVDDAVTTAETNADAAAATASTRSTTTHFNANDSLSRSFFDDTNADLSLIVHEPNLAGVILQRSGYYTIPPLSKLSDYMTDDGACKVPNFTIGRRGYGNVYYDCEVDVANLNLDELVHFRHKEVVIYPDDENKPPIGTALNRKAQITLDQVWPHDKTLREPIKDRERLESMGYEDYLRRVCDKHDMRFIDYRPETGSWVFKVDHFSKYGLSDSDEDDVAADPKKAKLAQGAATGAASTGAIPKAKPIDSVAKGTSSSSSMQQQQPPQQQGLSGFDARYEPSK